MEPVDYLRILRRRWAVILASCVVAVLATFVIAPTALSANSAQTYISTATLVQPPEVDRPLGYVTLLIRTGPVPEAATQRVVRAGEPHLLEPEINVLPDEDSGAISISVIGDDPAGVVALVDALVDEIMATLGAERAGNPGLRALERASEPELVAPAISAPSTVTGRLVLALAVGLLFGGALALFLERFDTRIHDRIDVQRIYGVPVLGEIPRARRGLRKVERITMLNDPTSVAAETYRSLRSSVLLVRSAIIDGGSSGRSTVLSLDEHTAPRLLMVTSARAAEGKTTTVVNLAAAMGEAGKTVVVVDCDFRKPAAHEYLDVPRGPGLSDLMHSDEQPTDIDSIARPTVVSRVRLVGAGTMLDTTPMLPSRMAALVVAARSLADIVIVDTPPLLGSNEAMDLMPYVDAVLVVCRSGRTTTEQAYRTSEILARLRVPVVGAALIGSKASGMTPYLLNAIGTSAQPRRRLAQTVNPERQL